MGFHVTRIAEASMKYLCLAYEEESTLSDLSEDEWRALRAETLAYVEALRSSGHLLEARPLQSATQASMVRVRDGAITVTDGPFAETKEQIGGYFLIEADGFDEALRIAAGWPSARIGSIEVRPVLEVLGAEKRY
jgi:hypothetical protein